MNKENSTNKYFEQFLNIMEENKNKEQTKESVKNAEIMEKENILRPIAEFLVKVREAGVLIYPYEYLFMSITEQNHTDPIEFQFYKKESENNIAYDFVHPSPMLVIKNPAPIEIGVINDTYRDTEGIIQITCGNAHTDSQYLKGNYKSVEDALNAIILFFGKNAVAKKRKQY